MKMFNVFNNYEQNLQQHRDERGVIADVFFKANINHVAIIESVKGSVRGNHYHSQTVQSILVISGGLEYWYKESEQDIVPRKVIAHKGDLIISDQGEIHAMKILENNTVFIAFTDGKRGGSDYESDTIRVPSIIPEESFNKD